MAFRIGLGQSCHPADGNAVEVVELFMQQAKQQSVDLLVFPESLMTRYEKELQSFLAEAEPLDGPFCQAVDALAKRYGLWVVYTVNEAGPDPAHPYNTVVITGADGIQRGCYRKTHLFDTDYTHESDRMTAGDALFQPVDTPFGRIGLGICYDLRFPEVARFAALHGAQLMIFPAAWVDGPLKAQHWKTLLAARAIENEMFVAGLSRPDANCIGQSQVVGPTGEVLAEGGRGEELVVADIDLGQIAPVRVAMPLLQHRRPELYAQ
ncbi:MAG: nitrilase-related carbon-nitrogen hydrolase [Coriobacteriia bacterium]|nr:nitrilase-related carbon-nitrogen hydrolase [Coriobacteriia bacterium]